MQKIVNSKFFWQKVFLCQYGCVLSEYSQCSRSCNYASQGVIKSQKVIASLLILGYQSSFLKNSLIRRYTLGNMHHLIGRNIALFGNYILIKIYIYIYSLSEDFP